MTAAIDDKRLDWIGRLHRIGQAIALRKPALVCQSLVEHIVQGFSASSGGLALLEPDGLGVRLTAATGNAARFVGQVTPLGDGVLGWVVENRRPLLLSGDVTNDGRFRNLARRDPGTRPPSALCWPLIVDERVLGAISLNRDPNLPPFTQKDMDDGWFMVSLLSIVVENMQLHVSMKARIAEQQDLIARLHEAKSQLLQSEKMAAIGQLAAGVAHEINNPIGYVNSNLGTLQKYLDDLIGMIVLYAEAGNDAALVARKRQEIDLEFLKQDALALVTESREGIERVKKIVQDLKDFSHTSDNRFQAGDLHLGLNSTLNIVWNEIKYKARVVKEYGEIPPVECIPSQINQVFMNLLVNAAQAIDRDGAITIRTGRQGDGVYVEIADTGKGIAPENLKRIFEPFFTTKPVGKGTGLGLSLSYGIVQKHNGRIEVESEVGKGATFRVWVPERQPARSEETGNAERSEHDQRRSA
jgi:signal transduction histidine kinase